MSDARVRSRKEGESEKGGEEKREEKMAPLEPR